MSLIVEYSEIIDNLEFCSACEDIIVVFLLLKSIPPLHAYINWVRAFRPYGNLPGVHSKDQFVYVTI